MIGNLKMDIRRAFCSYKFLGGIIGISIILSLNCINFFEKGKVYDIIGIFTSGQAPFFSDAILIFAVLPYSLSFCNDWNNRYIRCEIIRSSVSKYAISKIITCAISSIVVLFLGRLFFIILCLPFCNPVNPETNSYIQSVSNIPGELNQLLFYGEYVKWILIRSFRIALEGSIFSIIALTASTIMTNIFITIATPIFTYYLLNALISNSDSFPMCLKFNIVFENAENVIGNATDTLIFSFAYAVIVCAFIGFFFFKGVERRLENG